MKSMIIISILLISCVTCGCVGSEDGPEVQDDYIQTGVMTCYDKEIDQGKYNTYYIIVFVDNSGESFQSARSNDPSIYTKVEIGNTYDIEYDMPHSSVPRDIHVLNIVECAH